MSILKGHWPRPISRALMVAAVLASLVFGAGIHLPPGDVPSVAASPVVQLSAASREAYDLLLDEFVHPVGSAELVTVAWSGAVRHIRRSVALETTPALALTHGRENDWSELQRGLSVILPPDPAHPAHSGLDEVITRAMVASLDEAHTRYLSASSFSRSRTQQRGDYRSDGVGIVLGNDFTIVEVIEASPAAAANVRAGDRLLALDSVPVFSIPRARPFEILASPAGTTIAVRLQRHGTAEPTELLLTSATLDPDWISARVLDGAVGYLRLRRFEFLSGESAAVRAGLLDEHLARFDEASVSALILDLRSNPGGSVQTGLSLLSRFAPAGTVLYQTIERDRPLRDVTSSGRFFWRQVPIVVLVNHDSASMSELTASALQEAGLARVAGQRTRGAVATATLRPLSDGAGLSITVGLVNTASGAPLNEVGVTPDIPVELRQAEFWAGRDTQLEAALADLHRSRGAAEIAEFTPAA